MARLSKGLYDMHGDIFSPSIHAGSPWSITTQHGGPINALFMYGMETAALDKPKRVVRLSVDILRPVPREPLRLNTRILREGRRLAVVDAVLECESDGMPVAVARAQLLQDREDHKPLFPHAATPIPPLKTANRTDLISEARRQEGPPGFHLNIEMRHGADKNGPIGWFTWSGELITGLATSPAQRCAAICDLATIVSGRMRLSGHGGWDNNIRFAMLNTDTIIQFLRPPIGDWFAFHAPSIFDERGVGITEARLHDKTGALGQVVQTLASNAL